MDDIAPVDYAIIAFPGNEFTGRIIPAIAKLVENGTIRLIDVVFVTKDASGGVGYFDMTDVEGAEREAFDRSGGEVEALFSDEDLAAAAEELEPNSSAVLLVWENLWALEVAKEIRAAGGVLLDFDRIPHEIAQAARDWAHANETEA